MFKQFLGKFAPAKRIETQREAVERALAEVNAVVAGLAVKPVITIDPATGALDLTLPQQMPDEALALPAPAPETSTDDVKEAA